MVSAPARVTWSALPAPGARLRFGCALQRMGLSAREGGVEFRREALDGCWFRIVAWRRSQAASVVWERRLEAAEAGEFIDVTLDLEAYAGEEVEFDFLTETAGEPGETAGGGGPFACWSEPVLLAPEPDPPPNILVLLLDTLRADRIGCYGWERALTPNIDALAAQGVRFEDVMSAGPWTLPSHASLFTSSYISEHGIWSQEQRLPETSITLAEVLRERGYLTAAFTEGGYVRAEFGFAQGFDTFQARRREVEETFALAREWMRAAGAPFFAFVQTYRIHSPLDPRAEFRERLVRPYTGSLPAAVLVGEYFARWSNQGIASEDLRYLSDLYDAEVATADQAVGELLAFLDRQGLSANTLVVLTSDHGEELGEHGGFDHGWSLYQDQLRVPLILRLPGRFDGGRVERRTVHGVDLAPTLAQVAAARLPEIWSGLSLEHEGGDDSRPLVTPFLTRKQGAPAIAIRAGNLKYVDYPPGERTLDAADGGPKLYDLAADPGEQKNLWRPEDRARWQRAAESFLARFTARKGGNGSDAAATTSEEVLNELENLGYAGDE
jgi:arylsulfatase A-like enzyme